MNRWKALPTLLASVFLAGAAAASPASAASNPYTPSRVCGSGYAVVKTYTLSTAKFYVLYNSSTGYNCVTTIKTASVGTATPVAAGLKLSGDTTWTAGTDYDSGNYKYYAGPIKKYARHHCIDVYGYSRASSGQVVQLSNVFCG